MVQRLKAGNKATAFKGVILATDSADRASYTPTDSDRGAILIQIDTLETFQVVAGPALQASSVLPTFTDVSRGSSAVHPQGYEIWNTSDMAPNFADGVNWRDSTGTPT